ncbi:MAG: hypothetical protein JRJ47_14910, partial [Deltaproteobacteria bacterium]|nr:hypothetical protein [Deltaproteobacteria bacterium]
LMASSSQSHATHFFSDKGPQLPHDESGCYVCHADGILQCQVAPAFADGNEEVPVFLETTTVCDPCHSPGGAFPGGVDPLWDPNIGAKANWTGGIYNEAGDALLAGKEDWCAGCHDDGSCVTRGVSAPNVMGDGTYGYKISGHGAPGIEKKCEDCHDVTISHTDSRQRTYSATADYVAHPEKTYKNGYRLVEEMTIPRDSQIGSTTFRLCTNDNCHAYNDIISFQISGFRDDLAEKNGHLKHLEQMIMSFNWDSDWSSTPHGAEGTNEVDSHISCPACHNVHGSPTPAMIRHGELISTPGTDDKVPALDFKWYVGV